MRTGRRLLVIAALLLLGAPLRASAQTTLRDDLRTFFQVDFLQRSFPGTPDTSETVGDLLGAQISTFPITSSSSGFAYHFDPAIGALARSNQTFGPTFAERPATIGRRKMAVGFTHQSVTYDSLADRKLDGQNLTVYEAQQGGRLYFTTTASLKVTSTTDLFFASVGASDRFDLAVAIPFVRVGLGGTTVFRDNRGSSLVSTTSVTPQHSVSGVGDVALKAKYRFVSSPAADVGVAFDVRLPTGDEANFLGGGKTTVKGTVLVSHNGDRWTPYGNLGFTGGGVSKEVTYVGGIDVGLNGRVSVAADILGRRLLDVSEYREASGPWAPNPTFNLVLPSEGPAGLNLVLATAGAKVNVAKRLLLTGGVMMSLSSGGLRDRVTPVVGIDWLVSR